MTEINKLFLDIAKAFGIHVTHITLLVLIFGLIPLDANSKFPLVMLSFLWVIFTVAYTVVVIMERNKEYIKSLDGDDY